MDTLESANAEVKSETNKVKENLKVLLKLPYGHSKIADSSLAYKFADKIYAPHSLHILGKKEKEKGKGKTKQNKKSDYFVTSTVFMAEFYASFLLGAVDCGRNWI